MTWKTSKTNPVLNTWVDVVKSFSESANSDEGNFLTEEDKKRLNKAVTTIRLMFNRYAKNKKEV